MCHSSHVKEYLYLRRKKCSSSPISISNLRTILEIFVFNNTVGGYNKSVICIGLLKNNEVFLFCDTLCKGLQIFSSLRGLGNLNLSK